MDKKVMWFWLSCIPMEQTEPLMDDIVVVFFVGPWVFLNVYYFSMLECNLNMDAWATYIL
jgi:hypothetical protein